MTNSIECQIENCGPSFAMPPILPSVARSKPSSILLGPSLQRLRRQNRLSEALHQKQRDLVEARPCLRFEGDPVDQRDQSIRRSITQIQLRTALRFANLVGIDVATLIF
jgi:hypothetical protein